MTVDYSPFTPGQPVPVDLFAGRREEIQRLTKHVAAATQGRLQVAFLSGERGIGKSSLASLVRFYASRNSNMVGAHVFLGGADTLQEMVRRLFEAILHESKDKNWYDSIAELYKGSVQSAELFGLKLTFSPTAQQLDALVRNFPHALDNLISRLQQKKKAIGLTLVLDDINGLASSREFANWLKSTIDQIATTKPLPLCILVVGLEERRQSLVELQPSLNRAFHLFNVEPWSQDETKAFFKDAYSRAGVTVDPGALSIMAIYAGGLPVIAHEIGEAALREADNKNITSSIAGTAIINAAEIIGRKYLRRQVLDATRGKKYRSILHKVAKAVKFGTLMFERTQIKELLTKEEAETIDNFLLRMRRVGVIERVDGLPGTYRFVSHILHLYIHMSTTTEHKV